MIITTTIENTTLKKVQNACDKIAFQFGAIVSIEASTISYKHYKLHFLIYPGKVDPQTTIKKLIEDHVQHIISLLQ